MKRRGLITGTAVLLGILLSGSVFAQERVVSIKLLAPGVGWAIKGNHLFWTSDNGAQWTDITPPAPSGFETMSSIFFLDSRVGWVLFAGGGETPAFHLASTTDAGASWSVTPVTLPPPGEYESPLGGGRIAFSDALYGWIDIVEEGGAAFAPGTLAMTTDGGRTWRWAPDNPHVIGSLLPVTADELWLAGGPDNSDLYVTYDRHVAGRRSNCPPQKRSPQQPMRLMTSRHSWIPSAASNL